MVAVAPVNVMELVRGPTASHNVTVPVGAAGETFTLNVPVSPMFTGSVSGVSVVVVCVPAVEVMVTLGSFGLILRITVGDRGIVGIGATVVIDPDDVGPRSGQ